MATHPENSIAGFLHAMAVGADGVELDVIVTSDNRLAVTHDLIEGTLAQLRLPSLDDVLALPSPENFWFDIEAKASPRSNNHATLLSQAIRRSPIPHRVLVRSFDHDFLRAFHSIEPTIALAALIDYPTDDWPAIAQQAGARIISPHYSTITKERVDRAHKNGIQVSAWTVNAPAAWDQLASVGVDTIITDDPAAAVQHFKAGK